MKNVFIVFAVILVVSIKKAVKVNKIVAHKISKEKAMPQVKKLVKEFGRTVVQGFLNSLREYEAKMKELERVTKEKERLEKELM